jgi:DNA-binding NarL/FixJ family response regulator
LTFRDQPGFQVVGEASNGRDAVTSALKLRPDVAVLDIGMPELNGIEATRAIRGALTATQVVILSMHADSEHVALALQAGARGYLLKDSAGRDVVEAVRAVKAGRRFLSPALSERMIDDYLQWRTSASSLSPLQSLSAREREVLHLVAGGLSSSEIGRQLSISPKTVDTYRSRMMRKLGVSGAAELIRLAIENGLS